MLGGCGKPLSPVFSYSLLSLPAQVHRLLCGGGRLGGRDAHLHGLVLMCQLTYQWPCCTVTVQALEAKPPMGCGVSLSVDSSLGLTYRQCADCRPLPPGGGFQGSCSSLSPAEAAPTPCPPQHTPPPLLPERSLGFILSCPGTQAERFPMTQRGSLPYQCLPSN